MLEERRRERTCERRNAEDGRGRGARARDEPFPQPADDEDRSEEQHARGEHANQPQRPVSLEIPVGRRLRDPDRTLELERWNREERHPGRLVRVGTTVKERAIEQIRLEHQRVVEDEMSRQLVARAILGAGEADRRQGRKCDQRKHERLEPVPAESHEATS